MVVASRTDEALDALLEKWRQDEIHAYDMGRKSEACTLQRCRKALIEALGGDGDE